MTGSTVTRFRDVNLSSGVDEFWDTVILCPAIRSHEQTSQQQRDNKIFYDRSKLYWQKIPPTLDGMLGGFPVAHGVDIIGSQMFLTDILDANKSIQRRYALDCGAGIGRVSKNLLVPIFDSVDLVEQNQSFLNAAIKDIGTSNGKLKKIYNMPLQDFTPEPGKYDVIWCQWILSYLTNGDMFRFLKRVSSGLRKNGMIFIKENLTSSEKIEIDTKDSSVTRPLNAYKAYLNKAGYRIYRLGRQNNIPRGLYPVYMIAGVRDTPN